MKLEPSCMVPVSMQPYGSDTTQEFMSVHVHVHVHVFTPCIHIHAY